MTRVLFCLIACLLAVPAMAQPMVTLEAHGGRFVMLDKDAIGYLPDPDPSGAPAPVMIVLHGRGGNAATALAGVVGEASRRGIALVAPKSRGQTWDALRAFSSQSTRSPGRLPGGDAKQIANAVEALSAHGAIDRSRIALFGFSDGATMALSLGAARPADYPLVIAFAPGGILRTRGDAEQRFMIAHGTEDAIIPFSHGAGRVCPAVERLGRDVRFLPYGAGHVVDPAALGEALDSFLDPARPFGSPGCP
ncbi:alpha/beta hydrolase [Sphingomicrobium clamense]|uniref:Phospholipase/carboxylesterase/thioesterase domain-containing protein n=1 Tax=Sphingomicrobium clamense TaxID=2851013 RepID=A0ABS6V3Y4_9SPHN|nr:prolyl oligopeptidase family serine peptidase [Sphingomicrobium sp. B8]MBW0144258.1 hypothetical protein [Sphingomicrobium sp. B8]